MLRVADTVVIVPLPIFRINAVSGYGTRETHYELRVLVDRDRNLSVSLSLESFDAPRDRYVAVILQRRLTVRHCSPVLLYSFS